jgi:hypothetical protein
VHVDWLECVQMPRATPLCVWCEEQQYSDDIYICVLLMLSAFASFSAFAHLIYIVYSVVFILFLNQSKNAREILNCSTVGTSLHHFRNIIDT